MAGTGSLQLSFMGHIFECQDCLHWNTLIIFFFNNSSMSEAFLHKRTHFCPNLIPLFAEIFSKKTSKVPRNHFHYFLVWPMSPKMVDRVYLQIIGCSEQNLLVFLCELSPYGKSNWTPSGARGTRSSPATPHHLQNPKWPPEGPKMANRVWKGLQL